MKTIIKILTISGAIITGLGLIIMAIPGIMLQPKKLNKKLKRTLKALKSIK